MAAASPAMFRPPTARLPNIGQMPSAICLTTTTTTTSANAPPLDLSPSSLRSVNPKPFSPNVSSFRQIQSICFCALSCTAMYISIGVVVFRWIFCICFYTVDCGAVFYWQACSHLVCFHGDRMPLCSMLAPVNSIIFQEPKSKKKDYCFPQSTQNCITNWSALVEYCAVLSPALYIWAWFLRNPQITCADNLPLTSLASLWAQRFAKSHRKLVRIGCILRYRNACHIGTCASIVSNGSESILRMCTANTTNAVDCFHQKLGKYRCWKRKNSG